MVQLRHEDLSAVADLHGVGDDIGEMQYGGLTGVLVRLAAVVMRPHRLGDAWGDLPALQQGAADIGVIEAEALALGAVQDHAATPAFLQEFEADLGDPHVHDEPSHVVQDSGDEEALEVRLPLARG